MFVVYIVLRSTVFLINKEGNLYNLSSLGRLVYCKNVMGIVLVLVILSLGGLPPLTGFLKKFIALECLLSKKLLVPCAILIVGSLLRLFFYLRIRFKRVLCLFPQHSMMLFSWRNVSGYYGNTRFYTVLLRILSRMRILGLLLVPALWSYH